MKKETSTKKVEKKQTKTVNKKQTKTEKTTKENFLTGVMKEMKKVRWPLKKEMIKFSVATISFIIFFALFFMLADFIIATIKMWG